MVLVRAACVVMRLPSLPLRKWPYAKTLSKAISVAAVPAHA
jgi:hypothetical protein